MNVNAVDARMTDVVPGVAVEDGGTVAMAGAGFVAPGAAAPASDQTTWN